MRIFTCQLLPHDSHWVLSCIHTTILLCERLPFISNASFLLWAAEFESPISWTAETVEKFLPPFSVSETKITKVLSQYSSVMICVGTIILPILAMVWGLRACELVVTNKSCLLTCVLDTQRGGRKFSTVSAVQEIKLSKR